MARQRQGVRGREDQGRAAPRGHRHVAPPHLPDRGGRGHGGLVFEGPVPAASGQAERRSGPEHLRPRIQWLRPAHVHRRRPGLREGRQFMGVDMPARRPREPRDRGPRRRDAARRGSRAGRVRRAALPVGRHRGVPRRPGRRVHRGTRRAHARRVRHHAFAFQTGQPVRQRGGRVHRPSRQEGTHIRQHIHERGTAALGPEQVRVVVRPPAAPLDPRLHESRGVHATRKDPPGTVQHTVANPRARRAL